MSIIEVNHVTKEYRLGQMKSLKQSMLGAFDRLSGRLTPKQEGMGQALNASARVKSGLDPFSMDSNYQNLGNIASLTYLPHRFFDKNTLMDRLSIRENGIPRTGIFLKGCQQLLSVADYAVNIFPYVLRLIALCRRKQIDLLSRSLIVTSS